MNEISNNTLYKTSDNQSISTIKQLFKVRANELILTAIIPVIAFILGHVVLRLVLFFDNSEEMTSFELGTVLAAMFSLIITVIVGALSYRNHFSYAIAMGKRRIDTIIASIVFGISKGIIVSTLLFIFHTFESYVLHHTYANIPIDVDFDLFLKPQLFFMIVLILAAIENFAGAFAAKFGAKTFFIVYMIFMLSYPPLQSAVISTAEGTATGIKKIIGEFLIGLFSGITINTIMIAICCICLIFITLPFFLLRKYRVDM